MKIVVRFSIPLFLMLACLLSACAARSAPPAPGTPMTSTAAPSPGNTTATPTTAAITTATTTAPPPTTAATVSVPTEFQALYGELDHELQQFEITLNQKWDGRRGQTVFCTELAFANGNIGEGLLLPETIANNRLLLDCLQAMGVKGVLISLKFPLLDPSFPRSSEYLKFYQDIAAEVRRRGMKIVVETGAVFAGTSFSSVKVDWSKYTAASFLEGMQDQLVLISKEVRPDYLTLTEEPGTQEALTGLKFSPSAWSSFVTSTLKQLDRYGGMLVGTGMGSWEDPAYAKAFLSLPGIDYLDLHIYPMGKDGSILDRALSIAQDARRAGKRVTIGESWLYKTMPEDVGSGTAINEDVFKNDAFSFWYPLDARFIGDIMNLADAATMDFTSFFWTRNFLAYLDYDSTLPNASVAEINRRINQAALADLKKGTLSPLGEYYKNQLQMRAAP